MHSTVTLTRPAKRDTLSHLPAPTCPPKHARRRRLRQAGRMGEGWGEGSVQRIPPTRKSHPRTVRNAAIAPLVRFPG